MTREQIIQSFKDSFGDESYAYERHVKEVGETTVRCEFVDWLDYLRRDGQITDEQQFETTASRWELIP